MLTCKDHNWMRIEKTVEQNNVNNIPNTFMDEPTLLTSCLSMMHPMSSMPFLTLYYMHSHFPSISYAHLGEAAKAMWLWLHLQMFTMPVLIPTWVRHFPSISYAHLGEAAKAMWLVTLTDVRYACAHTHMGKQGLHVKKLWNNLKMMTLFYFLFSLVWQM